MKKLFILSAILVVALPLTLCSFMFMEREAMAQGKVIEVKLSHAYPTTYIRHAQALKFKELVETATQGRVQVRVFPAAQLYKPAQELEALAMNNIQFALAVGGNLQALSVPWAVYAVPFVFYVKDGNLDHLIAFEKSEFFQKHLVPPIEAKGYKFISVARVGVGAIWATRNKPLRKADDFIGLKLRNVGGEMATAMIRAAGASPVTIAATEAPAAIEQGVIDGTTTTWNTVGEVGWPLKYVIGDLYSHTDSGPALISNQVFWKSLPADIQKIIMEKVAPEFHAWASKEAILWDQRSIQYFLKERGGTITSFPPAEVEKFESKMKVLFEKFVDPVPELKQTVDFARTLRPKIVRDE